MPANLAGSTAYPKLPRPEIDVVGEDRNTIADNFHLAALVARARIDRIDPPFWYTANDRRPAVVTFQTVATPAHLTITKVYRGPPLKEVEAAIEGACFTPTH